jgi:hypothetical protein
MSPALDQDLGLEQPIEELAVEKLGAEFPVERFDTTILPRASGCYRLSNVTPLD